MSETYSDVDRSCDPFGAVAWQERMATWPAVRGYKERTYELVASARRVVDIGCGPGVDVTGVGAERCIGVEPSVAMAATASGRGCVVVRADALHLPFKAGTVDAVRADRVFQHLVDPAAALEEAVRVTAPGGRIVIADPDQATLAIEVPGARPSVVDRLVRLRRTVGYRNGTFVSEIPEHMRTLGLRSITTETFPLTLTDPGDAFGLPGWPEVWRVEGSFTDEEIAEWRAVMQRRPVAGFSYRVDFVVVAAITL